MILSHFVNSLNPVSDLAKSALQVKLISSGSGSPVSLTKVYYTTSNLNYSYFKEMINNLTHIYSYLLFQCYIVTNPMNRGRGQVLKSRIFEWETIQ